MTVDKYLLMSLVGLGVFWGGVEVLAEDVGGIVGGSLSDWVSRYLVC